MAPGCIAVLGSFLLHAALLSLLGLAVWLPPVVGERERLHVVWLHDWQVAETPDVAAQAQPPSSEAVADVSGRDLALAAPVDAPPEPGATERPARETPGIGPTPERAAVSDLSKRDLAELPPVVGAEEGRAAAEAERDDVRLLPATDMEAARRRVLERMGEEGARERGYSTFSFNDVGAGAPPEEPDNGWSEVFEGPSRAGPSNRLLVPGQARTRVGRAARDLCNALTGGATVSLAVGGGVFALASICGSGSEGRSPLYALRLDHLKKLPFCYDELLAEEVVDSSGEAVATATRCVLLIEEERARAEEGGFEAAR